MESLDVSPRDLPPSGLCVVSSRHAVRGRCECTPRHGAYDYLLSKFQGDHR